MDFRQKLIATLQALRPVLDEGVMVIGSEVPNLLDSETSVPVIVSKDVDLGVDVTYHSQVKSALQKLTNFKPSPAEPSVLISETGLLEVNFVGIDYRLSDLTESYIFEDGTLPLLVFGSLSLLQPGRGMDINGTMVRLPEIAGLLIEKLLTERSSIKGDRDLLVALALINAAPPAEKEDVHRIYANLKSEERHQIRSNLAVLSLMAPLPNMPDPRLYREQVAHLLKALDETEKGITHGS